VANLGLLLEPKTFLLLGGVLLALGLATGFGQLLKRQAGLGLNPEVVRLFHLRVRTWWLMCSVLALTFLIGRVATVVMFGFISFWALREYVTLTPTRPGDHRALFYVFFLLTPTQFLLIGMDQPAPPDAAAGVASHETYTLYSVLLPVYGFLFIPARTALGGDPKKFLERTAKIQSGLMICVYCLSYAPALLSLPFPQAEERLATPRLLFFFVLVVQMADVFQYLWSKLLGRHVIAPAINPDKTWEGFLAGMLSASVFGCALYWATPFSPWQAAAMSAVIAISGFAGGMTMSAIKRDRGVSDYGTLVTGHGGILDRIDSICFAAPVFYHITRAFFT
jgi:phosphatidate cytidylyltransferase